MVAATKSSKQDDHIHTKKYGFEPLLKETYEGKHLSDPVPEIQVNHWHPGQTLAVTLLFTRLLRINGNFCLLFSKSKV
jgi:hypothetical protein